MTPKSIPALRSTQLGRIGTAPHSEPSALADVAAAAKASIMRPRKQYAALEARILFDAAGAAAADHQLDDPAAQQREAQRMAAEEAKAVTFVMDNGRENMVQTLPAARGNTVVVIDSRVTNYQSLLEGVDPNATVRVVGRDENGLQVISQLLGETGNVSSLQIVSHGQSGAIRLGNSNLDSISLNNASVASQLQGWQSAMTADADILILGCDVAQGSKGEFFVQRLADLTQADISASTDGTGSATKGGNWVLEFDVGQRDSTFVFSQQAIESYSELMAAGPTTTLSLPASTLIGAQNQAGSVTFDNTGTSIGYAPYVTVAFDSNRAPDPTSNTLEGITYVAGSGTFLGSPIADIAVLTFDGAGNASSPSVIDPATGLPVVFTAASYGMGPGDTLVIYQLPFGSFTPDNPPAKIDFKYNLGANADSGAPVAQGGEGAPPASISSKGLFLLGETPVAEASDPIVMQVTAAVATTNPIWYRTAYINSSREAEQVPGANDKQYFIAELEMAPGQTVLSNNGPINAANPGATTDRYVARLSIPANINFDPAVDVTLNYNPASTVASPTDAPISGAQIFVVNRGTGTPALAGGVDDGTTPNLPVRNALGVWVIARPTGGANDNKVDLIAIAPAGTSYTGGVLGLELNYFIPDTIIDPSTGTDVPQSFDAKHTGNVRFADGDDPQNAPFNIDPAPVLIEYETIQIQKTVAGTTPNAIDPSNPAGVRSGDVLTYTLVVQVGDFYGLRDAVITDTLADGLEFETGSMTVVSGNVNGQATNGIAVAPTVTTSNTNDFSQDATVDIQSDEVAADIDVDTAQTGVQVGGLGKQVLQFNLSAAIAGAVTNTGLNGARAGDLIGDAFGNAAGAGLTTITITYRARVLDTYRVAQNGNITAPAGQQVLENDILPNNARISGILLRDTDSTPAANIVSTGLVNADDSSATVTVKDGKLIQVIYAINGVLVGDNSIPKDPSGRPIVAAGDNVTYRLQYNLSQGDFNTLKLEAFLPDPIFQANDSDLNGTTNNFTGVTPISLADLTNGNAGSNWAQAGAFTLGPNHNQPDVALADVTSSTTNPAGGNSVGFLVNKSSSIDIANSTGKVVDFLFTVKASDRPYADNLLLTSQGRETGQRSVNNNNGLVGNPVLQPTPLPDDQIIQIVRAEPRLTVSHGVIAKVAGQGGDITGNTFPGAALGAGQIGQPIAGIVSSAGQINGDVTNVDAGDVLRMGFAIQNTGGSGAFDVKTTAIDPPPGYKFVSLGSDATAAGNNFQVRTGAGALLTAGVDFTVTIDGNGKAVIELIDGTNTAKLGKGRNADGTTVSDGSNIIVITYDIVADDGTAAKAVAADNARSVLAVDSYASRNGGTDFTTTLNAATDGQVRDDALLEIARPQVDIRWQGDSTDNDPTATNDDSNQAHTTGADLVIGEKAYFDIKVTVPEGITNGLFADINLPPGLKLDTSYNGGIGYEIIQTAAGVGVNGRGVGGQLAADFVGTGVNAAARGNIEAVDGGTLGNSDTNAQISLGTITNTSDNNSGNNSFIVRVRVVVDNEISNQQGVIKTSTSDAVFSDLDGLTGTGGILIRDIADTTTANDPTITIVEPTVTTVKTVKIVDVDPAAGPDVPGPEADENDVVEFTILLTNTSGVKAWDLSLSDQLPSQFTGYTLVSVDSAANPGTLTTSANAFRNGTAATLGVGDFAINAGVLSFAAGNNYDLDPTGTIRVTVRGTANASIASLLTVNNDATTRWTSLDRSSSAPGDNNTVGNTPAGERGGADNLLTGGSTIDVGAGTSSGTTPNQASAGNGLNNYQTASRAVVPVVATAPVLSRIGGLADTSPGANNNAGGITSDGSPTGGVAQNMAVGEITRFRMVTRVPAGEIANFTLTPKLPSGYSFLNDGTARVALISDSGMTATGITGNGVSAQQGDGTGTGNAAAFGAIQNSLTSANFSAGDPRVAGTAPTIAIAPLVTGAGSLAAPRFELGTVVNRDNDTDFEYIVVEFNVVVDNELANQSGTNLDTQFTVTTGNTILGVSNNTRDVVVEPNISNLSKTIVDFPTGTQNSTTPGSYAITVQNSFTSNGGTTAYDTQFRDSIPGATTASNVLISLDGGANFVTLAAFADAALGRSGTITGGVVDLNLGDVAVGTNVVIKYDTVVPTTNAAITAGPLTNAQVVFSGVPDIATGALGTVGFAGSSLTGDGSATGERNGVLVAQSTSPANDIASSTASDGSPNNYRNVDPAGVGTLSGTLWDDTNTADGNINTGERLLNGVTVTLLWAGADGTFGTADDRTLTTVTDPNGKFTFGALPGDNPSTGGVNEGRYRITAPTTVTRADSGDGADTDVLTPRFDRTDGSGAGSLNVAELVIGDGSTTATRDFGYVQPNDVPVNSFNGSSTFPTAATPVATVEDTPFAFTAANNAVITIADPDGNQGSGLLTTTIAAANGTLVATSGGGAATVSNSGTGTVTIVGTQAQINQALATLVYTPTNNFSGPTTITVTTNDQGQGGNGGAGNNALLPREAGGIASPDALQDVDVINLVVAPRSDAPLLTIGNTNPGGTRNTSPPALGTGLGNSPTQTVAGAATGSEDSTIPLGLSVASADPSNPESITLVTVSGVPAGWQLIGGGTSFTSSGPGDVFTIPAADVALLGIKPLADLNSTTTPPATLTIKATSQDGAGTPTAETTGTLTIGVIPVNDRPVVNDTTPIVLASIAEGTASSPAQNVGTLFTPRFSDPKDAGKPNGADAIIGVFVTGSAANATTEGAWEYFNGTAWVAIPAATSDATAIYLPNATDIRFSPVNSNYSGTPGQLTVRLVENDQTPAGSIIADVPNGAANGTTIGNSIDALTVGAVVNLSAPVGTPAAFATGRVSEELKVGIVVTPVSDAPVLTIGVGPQEAGNPPGTTGVESSPGSPATGNNATGAVTGSVRGLEDTAIPLGISVAPADTSNPEAVTTVVISGVPAGWILKDGAGNIIPTPGGTSAGLTPAQTLGATITAPADINSTGPVGTSPAATLTIMVSSSDGAAPPATTTGTLNVAVTPVNDRPVLTSNALIDLGTLAEGSPNSAAQTVGALFGPRFSDPKDGTELNGQDAIKGVFITGTLANPATEGFWEYSTDGGTTFTAVPVATSDSSAIYLANASLIRFKPVDANYSGTPGQLTARLVETEQTPVAGGAVADVLNGAANGTTIGNSIDALIPGAVVNIAGPTGNADQFAAGRVSEPLNVRILVTPVSDAPVLTIGVGPQEAGNPPGTTGVESSPGSPATGNNATGAVTGSVRGLEDTPIPLGISVAPADTSNPEAVTTVVISGVPAGWILKDGAGNIIPTPGGTSAGLTPAQTLGATITAPADINSTGPVGTSPAATLTITVSSSDGAAPPATTTGTLNVAVTPVNDAPLFGTTTPTVLPSFNEDSAPVPVTVQAAFPGYTDPKDAGKVNGADNRVGVLITANAATPAQGNWQYFDGTTWVDVSRNVSDTNALYLPDGTQIRFTPALNYNGTPGNLTARLVEDDQAGAGADLPSGATGSGFGSTSAIRSGVDLSAGVGGTSRVSANTRDVGITVVPVNDPPAVATPAPVLPVGDVPVSFRGPNSIVLSDPADTPFVPAAIVTVTITPTGNGRPFISALTPGVTQVSGPPVGTIPPGPGVPIVLTGTIADINATLQNLEYRSRQFYNGTDSFTVAINDNANGGPGPLQAIATVNVDNLPLNDRPVVNGPVAPDYLPLSPGATTPGRTVQDLFGPRYTDPRDAPSNNGGDVFAGIAIISTPPASQGIYQYSTDGGNTWIAIAADTTAANALVLAPNAQLRFVSNAAYVGETTPLQALLIETDQQLPATGDLLNRAGIPFDSASSAPPVSGTVLNLSTLEATELATTTNGIGRSRFSSLANPMLIGVRIDPPVIPAPVVTPADFASTLTPLPAVLTQFSPLSNLQPVGTAVRAAQAEAAAQQLASDQLFASNLGNSGLQPNWLKPEGIPGLDPFSAPLPELDPKAIADTPIAPRSAMTAEEIARQIECAKPRVVAKPRPPGYVRPAPKFEPGSPAAKRFSEQLKRAKARARC
jgi:uncharacterized repeat protein (TIGR01451 family)